MKAYPYMAYRHSFTVTTHHVASCSTKLCHFFFLVLAQIYKSFNYIRTHDPVSIEEMYGWHDVWMLDASLAEHECMHPPVKFTHWSLLINYYLIKRLISAASLTLYNNQTNFFFFFGWKLEPINQGWSQNFELGAVLLLVMCSNFNF